MEGNSDRSSRFIALDVLRALAIFGMGVSSMVPYKTLPAFMYHAQEPPPTRAFNDHVFGITWVDLVFPFFLFAMGAAIPLAISRRLEKGDSTSQTILGICWRGLLLVAFALLGQHLRPYVMEPEDPLPVGIMVLGLWGLFLLVGIFARYPKRWPKKRVIAIQLASWIFAILTISFIHYPDGIGFNNIRNDIILMVLANVAVTGSIIWLFTQEKPWVRATIFCVVAAIFLSRKEAGPGQMIWNFDPLNFIRKDHWPYLFNFNGWAFNKYIPIFYHFAYQKYLLILLPGTICGDLYLKYRKQESGTPGWGTTTWAQLALFGIGLSAIATVTMLARQVILCLVLFMVSSLILAWITRNPQSKHERLVRALIRWGIALTILGLIVEPLGGGIRKDEATFSYFILTSGLAFYFVAGLSAIVQHFKVKLTLLAEAGQNPILAYIAITNAIPGIFGLTLIWQMIDRTNIGPWPRLALDIVRNVFVLYLVALCTRRKLFLRA